MSEKITRAEFAKHAGDLNGDGVFDKDDRTLAEAAHAVLTRPMPANPTMAEAFFDAAAKLIESGRNAQRENAAPYAEAAYARALGVTARAPASHPVQQKAQVALFNLATLHAQRGDVSRAADLLEKGRLDPRGMPTSDLDWQLRAARMHSLALDELVRRDHPGRVAVAYSFENHEPRASIRIEVLERAEAALRAYVDALGLAHRQATRGPTSRPPLVTDTISEAKEQLPELLKLLDETARATHLAATNDLAEAQRTRQLERLRSKYANTTTTQERASLSATIARLESMSFPQVQGAYAHAIREAASASFADAKAAGFADDDVISTWQLWATSRLESVRTQAQARLESVSADRP